MVSEAVRAHLDRALAGLRAQLLQAMAAAPTEPTMGELQLAPLAELELLATTTETC